MERQIEPLAPTRIRQKSSLSKRHTRWTQDEDDLLIKLVSNAEHVNWPEIAPQFPGKTAQQVSERWSKVVNPKLVKGSWTRQEDETIILFVQKYGTKNWTKLATYLPGRIGKQCRERWRNHLDPDINRNPWTSDEDILLLRLHEQFGNQWVKISAQIPGRSDNAIKNRWNSTLKKHPKVTAHATPSTPTTRPDVKIETPQSADPDFPIPNLQDAPVRQTIEDPTPWAATPLKSGFDILSPFHQIRSPFHYVSPFLGSKTNGLIAFFSPDIQSLGTPREAPNLFSPSLRSPCFVGNENSATILNSLDELSREK